jgi:hypothetical protein
MAQNLRVTADVFSGRPNFTIELEGVEAEEALERLQPVRRLSEDDPGLLPEPTLGYRGLIIEQTGDESVEQLPSRFRLTGGDLFGPGLAHRAADEDFEDFIFGDTGPMRRLDVQDDFFEGLRDEADRFQDLRNSSLRPHYVPPPWVGYYAGAPPYESGWWNVPTRQTYNNCYNYATNYRTDTFAQPGRGSDAEPGSLSGADVLAAAVADELADSPNADNTHPKEGHLVALVVAPGWDFHWYRKGRDGAWSHKPGQGAVSNVDNAGAAIGDPRTADRGFYTEFCTFMIVMHGHIKIS